jgi:hypothetical protein
MLLKKLRGESLLAIVAETVAQQDNNYYRPKMKFYFPFFSAMGSLKLPTHLENSSQTICLFLFHGRKKPATGANGIFL